MNALISLLRPASLNPIQQVGRACTLIAIVIVVFLHNPFDGYYTADGPLLTSQQDVCGMELAMAARRSVEADAKSVQESQAAMAEVIRLREKCLVTVTKPANDLPFLQWSSNSPIIEWLGELGHLISTLIAAITIGAIWISAFSKRSHSEL